jgi:murein L,D-transpeptidase YcbB/YkuD
MKKNLFILFLLSFTVNTGFAVSSAEVEETLRRVVENRKNVEFRALGEPIFCSTSLPLFYQNNLYKMVWDNAMRSALIAVLEQADEEGLHVDDYHTPTLKKYLGKSQLNVIEQTGLELLTTDAFLLYATHLTSGKVNPETIDAQWHVVRRGGKPVDILNEALTTRNVQAALKQAAPQQAVYAGLKAALKRYRAIVKRGGWEPISTGETLKIGAVNDRVVALRKRLIISGDLTIDSLDSHFDELLEQAVKNFQYRMGLLADGEVGAKTIAAMNVSAKTRVEQLRLNMERWRWLPNTFSPYYIKVNIADFTLEVVKNGKKERSHKVIVGKAYRKTPVFSSKMTYLVLNPTWTVPPTILTNDVLPAVRKDVSYLKSKNLTVYDARGNIIDPLGPSWSNGNLRSFTYMQAPGPDNALGFVKFMFPNAFSVYLHDTPARELFEQSERSFSSGCVRVQDPLKLAEYLIGQPAEWSMDKINACITTRKPTTVVLKHQPEVYLLYWTAWAADNGAVHFRKDIYKRDEALLNSLNAPAPGV